MINITFPDGKIKGFENNPTGLEVANSISEGLARDCVALELNGKIVDLTTKIDRDADISLITTR
ncbi:MAG: TGS domain-containing protein, partial [Desulfobacterales bacterium]|nr:TGS domain-containing protein [Desulfobacterales bacterium]